MTPARLRECLALLHWTQRGLAASYGCDEASVRQWLAGRTRIPAEFADWLERAAAWMERHPMPRR